MNVVEYMNINTGKRGKCTAEQFEAMIRKPGFRGKFAKISQSNEPETPAKEVIKRPRSGYVPAELIEGATGHDADSGAGEAEQRPKKKRNQNDG